jgi:DNA-directed RNA polymerase sigma subunit (sigma70/sigma32)
MGPDDREAVQMYLRELAGIQPLSEEEEAQLFQEMEQHGERGELAERRLLESKLHLVAAIAEQHASGGISLLDLIQEGNSGLMRALREFPKVRSVDFKSYATSRIEEAIRGATGRSKTD